MKCGWYNCQNEVLEENGFCSDNCKNSYRVDRRRREVKQKAVDLKGGKCERCGYNKTTRALQFHHIDPSKKSFGIGHCHTRAWKEVEAELEKCILVCANCHAELEEEKYFYKNKLVDKDGRFVSDKITTRLTKKCHCGELIRKTKNYCSLECRLKHKQHIHKKPENLKIEKNTIIKRPSKDELEPLIWVYPSTTIAKMYGVSDSSIGKWCKYYGISKPGPGYWAKKASLENK